MKLTDRREDAMLEHSAWKPCFLFGIGEGTDPRWLQIKAEREAEYIRWILEGCPGFKGVKVTWPRNMAIFETAEGAEMGKKRLTDADIKTGDIMNAEALPGLKEIQIKKKWEARK